MPIRVQREESRGGALAFPDAMQESETGWFRRLPFVLRTAVLAASGLAFAFLSCRKPEEPAPSQSPVEAPAPQPTRSPPLARIEEHVPTVRYRRSQELVWADAAGGLSLYRHDGVQTHEEASARISYATGTRLELGERSFVIIEDPVAGTESDADRAVLRDGILRGETRRELWVLTTAAVVRVRPARAGSVARSTVQVREGAKLRVRLAEGQGTLTPLAKGPSVALRPGREVVVPAPPTSDERFGAGQGASNAWVAERGSVEPGGSRVKEGLARPAHAARNEEAPEPTSLPVTTVDLPPDQAETADAALRVSGVASNSASTVYVNGRRAPLLPNRSFEASVPLEPGANVVVVQEILPDGRSAFHRRTIHRTGGGR